MPIFKKKVKELIKELDLKPTELLEYFEQLAESMRAASRTEVYKGANDWALKKGIKLIRTDY